MNKLIKASFVLTLCFILILLVISMRSQIGPSGLWHDVASYIKIKLVPWQTNHEDSWQYEISQYRNETLKGIPFTVNETILQRLGLPRRKFVTLNDRMMDNFTFVTGNSANHFLQSMDAVASVQTHFPKYKIIYYDLGLLQDQVEQIKKLCSVTYKKFQFDSYPPHMRKLAAPSWKAICIQETLLEHDGALWFDASIRFRTSNLSQIKTWAKKANGGTIWSKTGVSTFACTHPGMYKYLPIDTGRAKKLEMRESGQMLFYNTKDIYNNVWKWFIACCLEERCISPIYKWNCKFTDKYTKYANCHRYDQSAVNVLFDNAYDFMQNVNVTDFSTVYRGVSHNYKLKYC